jgi:low temperature requirement protein LtrA
MKVAVSRAPGAERVVTRLELFFDLVYVFVADTMCEGDQAASATPIRNS